MKKILLTLVVALVAVPGYLRTAAVAASAPVSSRMSLQGPVEELITQMNALFKLLGKDKSVEDLTPAQMKEFQVIDGKVETLKTQYASYKLTATDRETMVRWARTTNEKLSGKKMTVEEIAELREELNGYKTFGDLTEELDLSDF